MSSTVPDVAAGLVCIAASLAACASVPPPVVRAATSAVSAKPKAGCTAESPCPLSVVELARRRVAQERETEARTRAIPPSRQNVDGFNRVMGLLRDGVSAEQVRFSQWCAGKLSEKAILGRMGQPLTPELLFPEVGQPGEDTGAGRSTSQTRIWSWAAWGPYSGTVQFRIHFSRLAADAWEFSSCSWCASGSAIAPIGCVELPLGVAQ